MSSVAKVGSKLLFDFDLLGHSDVFLTGKGKEIKVTPELLPYKPIQAEWGSNWIIGQRLQKISAINEFRRTQKFILVFNSNLLINTVVIYTSNLYSINNFGAVL